MTPPQQIPDAPACPSWCTEPHKMPGGWDAVDPHASGAEGVKWCRAGIDVPEQHAGMPCRVEVVRFADVNTDNSEGVRIDPPVIELEPYEFNLEQARALIAALEQALVLAGS